MRLAPLLLGIGLGYLCARVAHLHERLNDMATKQDVADAQERILEAITAEAQQHADSLADLADRIKDLEGKLVDASDLQPLLDQANEIETKVRGIVPDEAEAEPTP